MITNESLDSQKRTVVLGMEVYGGSFMQSIGKALLVADSNNTMRIYRAWTDDWNRYYEMGKTIQEN